MTDRLQFTDLVFLITPLYDVTTASHESLQFSINEAHWV